MQGLPTPAFLSFTTPKFCFSSFRSSVTHFPYYHYHPLHYYNYCYHCYYSLSNLYFHLSFRLQTFTYVSLTFFIFHFYLSFSFSVTFLPLPLPVSFSQSLPHFFFSFHLLLLILLSLSLLPPSQFPLSLTFLFLLPWLRLSFFPLIQTNLSSLPPFPNIFGVKSSSFSLFFSVLILSSVVFVISYFLSSIYAVSPHKFLISSFSISSPIFTEYCPLASFIPLPTRLPFLCTRSHRPHVDRKFYRTFNGHGEAGNHYPPLFLFSFSTPSLSFLPSSFVRQCCLLWFHLPRLHLCLYLHFQLHLRLHFHHLARLRYK